MMDDLLVRRAAVFGLGRSKSRSAQDVIRGLQLEDTQWIVRNAADQEIQKMEHGSQAIPRPLKPLHELGWLAAFAGESGEGIAPGRMAQELLNRALLRGSHEQVLAALERYKIVGMGEIREVVEKLAREPYTEVQTAALQTLWHMQAQGITTD
jgi:HEAT repeat protein